MSRSMKSPALAAAVAGSLLLAGSAFAATPLAQGYMLGADAQAAAKKDDAKAAKTAEHACGAAHKTAEGKCGEGKCGEGKCGASAKAADGKTAEGKCGEGKCGAKAGDKKATDGKAAEGKCGEGKCGAA